MSIDLDKYRAVAKRWEQSEQPFAAAAACLIEQLCDEITRLRLTDAEREEVSRQIEELLSGTYGYENQFADEKRRRAAVLSGLLERHAKGCET